MDTTNLPRTLLEAARYFQDSERCIQFFATVRWPDGVMCPTRMNKTVSYLAKQQRWQCSKKHPKRQFSVKVGTIFEDSPIPLEKWLPTVWLLVSCKNGISSYEVARALDVTQKTAWFMLHRIRLAMQDGTFEKMSGRVEADETFIGGLARNMHKSKRERVITGTGGVGKTVVMGLLERHTDPKSKEKVIDSLDYDPKKSKKASRVKVAVVPDRKRETLQAAIRSYVEPGSEVFTDELASYQGLSPEFVHGFVNHAEQYVKGHVHTNGMENFWALLKRMIKGSYVSVEPFHLFRYLDEEAFRFNERKHTDSDRFQMVMRQLAGKRLTYSELTGQDQPSVA
jgi:transposase-like protein